MKKGEQSNNQKEGKEITFFDVIIYLIVVFLISFLTYTWIEQEKEIELIESNYELTTGKIFKRNKGGKSRDCFKYEYVYNDITFYDEVCGCTSYPDNYINKKFPVKVYVDDHSKSIIVIDTLDSISQF